MTPLGRIISWPFLAVAAIPADKWAHFGIGAVLGLSSLWIGWLGVLPVISFAAAKEAWDYAHPPNRWDTWDFLATLAGGALSLGLIALHAGHL